MDQVAIDPAQFQVLTSPKIEMIQPGEGISLWVMGVLVTLKVLGNETTGSSYSVFEDEIPPGAGPALHFHTVEDESWYLLEGELVWSVGDREFAAKKGSFVHLPRMVPHTFSNRSQKLAVMLVTYAPGGFERWFLDVGTPVAPLHPPSEAQRAKAVQLMKEYGVFPVEAAEPSASHFEL